MRRMQAYSVGNGRTGEEGVGVQNGGGEGDNTDREGGIYNPENVRNSHRESSNFKVLI